MRKTLSILTLLLITGAVALYFVRPATLIAGLLYEKVAGGGMPRLEVPIIETAANPRTRAAKIKLPKATGLGTYGKTVAQNAITFTQSAADGFLSNINAATNLSDSQKKAIRAFVSQVIKKLNKEYNRLIRLSSAVAAGQVSEAQFVRASKRVLRKATVRRAKGKKRRVKGQFFRLPFGGRVVASESKAFAVYQLNSFIGFLIQFLTNQNTNSLIQQFINAGATTSQKSYLELLRKRLNVVLLATIKNLTKQTFGMLKLVLKRAAKKNRGFAFSKFLKEGDNSFSLLSDTITSGTQRSVSVSLNFEEIKVTIIASLSNVKGGPVQFKATLDGNPATMVTLSNTSANFDSNFANFVGFVAGKFDMTAGLTAGTFKDNSIVVKGSKTLVAGQASVSWDLRVKRNGLINGSYLLNFPGLPQGLAMNCKMTGIIKKDGTGTMYRTCSFATSLGTGGHSLSKFTLS
ncbi:MAG: hypothetical protein D6719_13515 [Candidatus Dadabacteria bacterium]|nr:MAG: hypothetical protein D6719_13515 [Candidatus Dadabacteria bacterium]